MNLELLAVDEALADVRRLLDDSGVSYKLVGGVAVVHHGYARTTEDVDVLIQGDAMARLQPILASHGFAAASTC
jgi:predicted nucleotidyltransferase